MISRVYPLSLFSSNNIHRSSAFKTTLRIVIFLSWKLYVFLFWFKKFYATSIFTIAVMYCLSPVDRARGEALTMCVSFNFHSKSIKWESSQIIGPRHREALSCSKQLPSGEVKVLTTVHKVSEVRALPFYHTYSHLCILPSEVLTLQRTKHPMHRTLWSKCFVHSGSLAGCQENLQWMPVICAFRQQRLKTPHLRALCPSFLLANYRNILPPTQPLSPISVTWYPTLDSKSVVSF